MNYELKESFSYENEELLKENFVSLYDKYNDKFYEEERRVSVPKTDLYRKYFQDQRANYPKKALTITIMSYIGGCFFGLIMLAFSMMGMSRFEMTAASLYSYDNYYKDMKEFKTAMRGVRINYFIENCYSSAQKWIFCYQNQSCNRNIQCYDDIFSIH